MFSTLFNKNKRAWLYQLDENQVDTEMKYIIVHFFIEYNVSIEMYFENQKAYNIISQFGDFDFYETLNKVSAESQKTKINPTYSFKKYFFQKINYPLAIDSWFIIAFPDVVAYFMNNAELFDDIQNENDFITSNGHPNLKFYKFLIKVFKAKHSTFELKI